MQKKREFMEGLSILTNIAVILLLGLLSTLVSKRWRISNVLLLVMLGIFLQFLAVNGDKLFAFSPQFLISVSILAIVMIVFDSTSRFRWKDLDEATTMSLRLTGWFALSNMVTLSFFAMLLIYREFSLMSYLYAMIFSSTMLATDPSSLFAMMGTIKNRIITLLEFESIINTPLTVLLPFVFLDLLNTTGQMNLVSSFIFQIIPFLQQLVVGVGAGIVIGVIIFKVMKQGYSEQLSPIGLITAALLAYVLAEHMEGSGILSVATLGVFFGSVYVKQKSTLQEFSSMLSNSLEILVFVLVGLMVSVPLTWSFFLTSLLLFLILLACRTFAVLITLRNESFKTREKLFAILNMPKGIAMAVVVFTFSVLEAPAITQALDYMLVMLVYSLILSTIVTKNSKKFIKVDIGKKMAES